MTFDPVKAATEEVRNMNDGKVQGAEPLVPDLANVPWRVREIAMLRGLGYSYREIGRELKVTPQAVSLMLIRHRRPVKSLRQHMDLLGLSPRAVNVLARHGVTRREEARARPLLDLIKDERNCGSKTIEEIRRWMDGEDSLPSSAPAARV
jgi:predicted transcriptional regulator